MRKSVKPVAVPSPSVTLPEPQAQLASEVVRLRRMVHALAEMLVECGVVDTAMVEGRLRLAVEAPLAPLTQRELTDDSASLKPPGLWARLFGKKQRIELADEPTGAVPSAMMPLIDQTVPVTKLPFEVQSLYDEGGTSMVGSAPHKPPTLDRPRAGTCNRCWRRALVNTGQLCARCAVNHG